ncbi:probable ribosome-binding factor A, chloroplastic [Glycine soja]|nr:probable ribosome-binding factor A, chloroplastic [Glycine max]XP_028234209.1 probable ribosome-binding factor A, chloroplastic [Glycine soja]RZC05158.1 putative ribosome-binding factor A, chloroplastic [Glycine soja]|eukprot:XP_003527611.1 probable ribosome-binding factor A, chloroplastic [Glycine max]
MDPRATVLLGLKWAGWRQEQKKISGVTYLVVSESEIAMLHPAALIASCPYPYPYPGRHELPSASASATARVAVPMPNLRGKAVVGVGSRMIRCMANPRRVQMVAKQIRRELSHMLLTDKVLQYAVLPEASLGADRYLSSLTTITDVQVSADLQVVKVYVSVFGDERGKEVAIAGLKSKAKYVRSELGKRIKLRLTPEIRFLEDDSFERGSRVIAILDKIKNDKSQYKAELDSSPNEDHDDDWDGEDPEEGIIYVE